MKKFLQDSACIAGIFLLMALVVACGSAFNKQEAKAQETVAVIPTGSSNITLNHVKGGIQQTTDYPNGNISYIRCTISGMEYGVFMVNNGFQNVGFRISVVNFTKDSLEVQALKDKTFRR